MTDGVVSEGRAVAAACRLSAVLASVTVIAAGCASPSVSPWHMPRPPRAAAALPRDIEGPPSGSSVAARGERAPTAFVSSDGWMDDENFAWEEARRSHRPLLLDFTAEWCVPCRLLEADTFTAPNVRARLAAHFVALRIDVTEETPSNREQLARYGVRGLPALLIFDDRGHGIDRIDHYLDADGLAERLDAARQRLGASSAPAEGLPVEPVWPP